MSPLAARSEEPATSTPVLPVVGCWGPGHLGQRRGEQRDGPREGRGSLPPQHLWFSGPQQPLPLPFVPALGLIQKGLFPRLVPTLSPLPLPRGQKVPPSCEGGTERCSALLTGVLVLGSRLLLWTLLPNGSFLPSKSFWVCWPDASVPPKSSQTPLFTQQCAMGPT